MLFILSAAVVCTYAQDIVVIKEGEFIRGTIKATNFSSVILKNEDESVTQYEAKNIKEFVWNGEVYVSKPILVKNRLEFRFFKLIEQGVVNLYTIGGNTMAEEVQPKRAKVRPSVSIGGGTGGFGGLGGGVGITLGGGRNSDSRPSGVVLPTAYFIEKPGTGPLQEIPTDGGKTQQIKAILLQKLTNDEDLTERIKATETFDAKLVRTFIAAYNGMKK